MTQDMRTLLNLVEAPGYVPPPDQNDKSEQDHWDASAETGRYGRQGAGAVFFARDTERFLVMLRAEGVHEAHTWGNCGGAFRIEEETPIEAAEREAREETGYAGAITMVPLNVYKEPKFTYYNFLAVVAEQFKPHLGWESDDFRWCEFLDWPQPLHYGLEALWADRKARAIVQRVMSEAEEPATDDHARANDNPYLLDVFQNIMFVARKERQLNLGAAVFCDLAAKGDQDGLEKMFNDDVYPILRAAGFPDIGTKQYHRVQMAVETMWHAKDRAEYGLPERE